jgi:RNA polymerase sigma-70 factor (ECF subfamily)
MVDGKQTIPTPRLSKSVGLPQPSPDLLRRACRGDEDAFTEIVRRYELPVFNYILRMVGNRPLAEDLTQDVLLRVHQAMGGFSGRCLFTTWLFQIARNRVVDELRAQERRPHCAAQLDDLADASDESVELPVERRDTVRRVWEAIEELDLDLRTVLLLRDVVGLPYREIAEVLQLRVPTVKWRIFVARERVATAVAGDERLAAAG